MSLDMKLMHLIQKNKKIFVVDLTEAQYDLSHYRRTENHRYVSLALKRPMGLGFAMGLASMGYEVILLGYEGGASSVPDPYLNIKIIRPASGVAWWDFDRDIQEFGVKEIMIPPLDLPF